MNEITMNSKRYIPSKVICVGRNYVEHIKELNNEIPKNMVLFNKPNSAISNKLCYFNSQTRFEGELCLLIIDKKIAGIGFGLDLTHADIQNQLKTKGLPWERAKAFDSSAVLSDFIPFNGDIEDINFKLYRNGVLAQEANYNLMIYKPQQILEEIQSFMSLEDGDIIMTGTPKGVSTYKSGDKFEAFIYEQERELLNHSWVCN